MTSQYRTRIAVVLLVTLLVGCGTPDTATQTIPTLPTTPTTVATSNSADDSLVTDTRNNATDLPPVARAIASKNLPILVVISINLMAQSSNQIVFFMKHFTLLPNGFRNVMSHMAKNGIS